MKIIGRVIILGTFACATAQAANIGDLNTGAGLYAINNGAVIVDPNWTVTLLETRPTGETPPGGIPSGAAYLVPNNIGFPFNGSWALNTPASSWLSYATPTPVGADLTDATFQYQLTFTASSSGFIGINFLADNTGSLFINGDDLGSNPGAFSAWLATPFSYAVTAGTAYTVDLDVVNAVRDRLDPTGARVEFSGDVTVDGAPVPDGSSQLINVALLALPLGTGILRRLRKCRAT